ncbi:MAG: cytochrome c3 family protein [Syntrophorhabdaceae bacterium]|nr:cytochrome c3 family protein [Syntrophorhabdaceae bacterium]
MAGSFLKALIISALIISLHAVADAGPTKTAGSRQQSCSSCHGDFSSLLPAKHPRVAGKDLKACTSCHASDTGNKAKPKPYSAKLHLSHMQPGNELDCLVCHTWRPGKSFGVRGAKKPVGVLSRENMDEMKKVFASWTASKYLDAHHGKKNVTCSGCHEKLPEPGDSVENDRCLGCHGDMEKLAGKTEPGDFPDRNPHKSHLGTINCTVCHKAHAASKTYCLECHKNFQMKIPFGETSTGAKAGGQTSGDVSRKTTEKK